MCQVQLWFSPAGAAAPFPSLCLLSPDSISGSGSKFPLFSLGMKMTFYVMTTITYYVIFIPLSTFHYLGFLIWD